MAFGIKGFARIDANVAIGTGAGSVRSLYRYATNDDAATVEAANYFNTAVGQFAVGDVIIASLDLDGTPLGKLYIVTAVTATVVTIAKFTYT